MKNAIRRCIAGFMVLGAMSANGEVIHVPADYATIQAGIDAATAGDTVQVESGTYNESVSISRKLILKGKGMGQTIIDGGGSGTAVIHIGAPYVTIAHLTARNGYNAIYAADGVHHIAVLNVEMTNSSQFGFRCIHSGGSFLLENCIVSHATGYGLYSHQFHNSTVRNCEFFGNTGAAINPGWGSNVKILGNYVHHNGGSGIRFDSCWRSLAEHNLVTHNVSGIEIGYVASGNTIRNNTFSQNDSGLYFSLRAASSSYSNTFYHNDIIDNGTQVAPDQEVGYQSWSLAYPAGGNYWSDYVGTDLHSGPDQDVAGADGIGDTPYSIPLNGADPYPLMRPVNNRAPLADAGGQYVQNATDWNGAAVSLDGLDSVDPDGDALTYAWDLDLTWDSDGDGNPSNDADETAATADYIFPIGRTDIALVVRDRAGLASDPDITSVTIGLIDVVIDIKPGSGPNSVNMGSLGVMPVAFLTDDTFDASTIDPLTITLRGEDVASGLVQLRGKKELKPMSSLEDVDGDGDLDLLVKLDIEKLSGLEFDADCVLGGLTYDGFAVSGSGTIRVVPE